MNNNWKSKFFMIWTGQAISVLTSSVLQMALIWQLSLKTGSAAILSLASMAGFLPTALIGVFAGTFVDRWNRKLVIIGADLFIAFVSLTLAVYALFAEIPVWLVLTVLFVRSVGTAFHTPAISAITPLIVPEDKLTKCSGYTQSLQSIGYIAGTAVAAVLYPVWSMSSLVMLDVLGAVIASFAVTLIKIPQPPKIETVVKAPFFHEIKTGYLAVKENTGIFSLIWIGAAYTFLYFPINALFPLMSMGHFGGTTTNASIAEIAFAAGMLLGGFILSVWGGFKSRGYTIIASIALMGLAIGLSGMLPSNGFVVFALLCSAMGLSAPFYSGPQGALIQEKFEPQLLGRIFGLYGSIMSMAMPLGLILSGLFADIAGIHNWFILSGAACVLLSGFALSLNSIRIIDKNV